MLIRHGAWVIEETSSGTWTRAVSVQAGGVGLSSCGVAVAASVRLDMSDNRAQSECLSTNREELAGEWKKLQNENLLNLY
jgi:hypothetical protein